MNEVWKDIPHYEGLYQVSNLGRVKSVERDIFMPNGTRNGHITEHIMPQNSNYNKKTGKGGYMFVNLYKNNKGHREYVHRLVALAFIPNPNNLPQVDHIDTIKTNNEVDNLRWSTQSENNLNPITNQRMRNPRLNGSSNRGDRNGRRTHPESYTKQNCGFYIRFKGTHYYNNGIIEVREKECPEGFTEGRLNKQCL